MSAFFTGLASTFITALISIVVLIGAIVVFLIVLALLDQWQARRAWRRADEMARKYMSRYCAHGFSTPDICPTCQHFNKIKELETATREGT